MSTNYDSSAVGVVYCRANNLTIEYPLNALPKVTISQEYAVKLADNSIVVTGPAPSFTFTADMVNHATDPVALVNPTTGANLGANTTLQQTMLAILAVVRQQQIINNP